MLDAVRQEVIATAETIVVKIGTSVLTRDDGRLHRQRLNRLCRDLVSIPRSGRRLVLVSSGAVGAGVGVLGLEGRPNDLARLQAAAAVGQSHLIQAYERAFRRQGYHVAQLLLTAADFSNRTRYLNIRNTICTLLDWGTIPVINENDTVSVEELRFGDNDRLAALVTTLIQAPLLIMLSTVDGLLTIPPQDDPPREQRNGRNSPPRPEVVRLVPRITQAIRSLAGPSASRFGTGGMRSKLEAARICMAAGESVILANGLRPGTIQRILAAEPVGTLFLPHGKTLNARKRWLAFSVRPRGRIYIDDGAARALVRQGRSLLPVGVRGVEGDFRAGDPVSVCDSAGREIARGLSNYSAEELAQIKGLRTSKVRELLGRTTYDEVIHRDNLALAEP